jgi:hypothetical protein
MVRALREGVGSSPSHMVRMKRERGQPSHAGPIDCVVDLWQQVEME